ncbi:MAG: iron-sulfur cluster assembly scaffold protein [Promethearchaeota archaeon]
MTNNFEEYVEKLQKRIKKEAIIEHNEKIVNLFYNPKNWGKLPEKDITVFEERRGGPKKYLLGLYLKIENKNIIEANFITDGCGVMVATGSQLTILIKNKSIDFAENLKAEDINDALLGLPKEEQYCTYFAIDILKDLIKKYKLKELKEI